MSKHLLTYEEAIAASKAKEEKRMLLVKAFNDTLPDIEGIFFTLEEDYVFKLNSRTYNNTNLVYHYWAYIDDIKITDELIAEIDKIKKKLSIGSLSVSSPLMKRRADHNNVKNVYNYTKGNRELLKECVGDVASFMILVSV